MDTLRMAVRSRVGAKYSSTLENFHQRGLNQLIEQEATPVYIMFEDQLDLDEDHQFMKRFYKHQEVGGKMRLFKEYYLAHQEKARIINRSLEYVYEKWHYRHRKLAFKQMYEVSHTTDHSSQDREHKEYTSVTHFLFNISTYNPYSKNYYLRKAAKNKDKSREGRSMESELGRLLDTNDFAKDLSQISFRVLGHPKYYSMDQAFGRKKQSKTLRPKRQTIKINLYPSRNTENFHQLRNFRSVKVLTLKGNKLGDNPQEVTSDRIVRTMSTIKLQGTKQTFRVVQKKKFPTTSTKYKPLDNEFSDTKFQTLKAPVRMPKLKPNMMQKATQMIALKLKC